MAAITLLYIIIQRLKSRLPLPVQGELLSEYWIVIFAEATVLWVKGQRRIHHVLIIFEFCSVLSSDSSEWLCCDFTIIIERMWCKRLNVN